MDLSAIQSVEMAWFMDMRRVMTLILCLLMDAVLLVRRNLVGLAQMCLMWQVLYLAPLIVGSGSFLM
jgi:hypothetical protein